MSALTELSEADELKAAVAATGEPRLIALLERLAVVEGKLADGSGADLRAAIDAWTPPTSSGQAAKTRLAELLTRLEAVEAVEAAPSKVDPAVIAALKKELDNACMAHNFSPKRAGRPSIIEKDFQAFKERLNTKAVAPVNAIKNQGKNEGTVDNPFDPAELPEVAAADKACRTAMRFMRKLDRLRGNFDPRDGEADATAASTKNAATAALEACAAGAPLDAARAAVDAARSAYGLAAQAATANSVARKSAERDACEGLSEAIEAAVTAVQAALAAHKNSSAPPVPPPAAAPAPVPPPAAAKVASSSRLSPTRPGSGVPAPPGATRTPANARREPATRSALISGAGSCTSEAPRSVTSRSSECADCQ